MTRDELRELLRYDPDTGLFYWKVSRRQMKAGEIAGHIRKDGYNHIGAGFEKFLAHRLAWLFMTGAWPTCDLDHINRRRADNRWANLREAPGGVNARNSIKRVSKLGIRGVTKARSGKFEAHIGHDRRLIYLGTFPTAAEAARVVFLKRQELHGEFSSDG